MCSSFPVGNPYECVLFTAQKSSEHLEKHKDYTLIYKIIARECTTYRPEVRA